MDDALRPLDGEVQRGNGRAVLILVLMDDALRQEFENAQKEIAAEVLILVLMDDALRHIKKLELLNFQVSLNPCFNG